MGETFSVRETCLEIGPITGSHCRPHKTILSVGQAWKAMYKTSSSSGRKIAPVTIEDDEAQHERF